MKTNTTLTRYKKKVTTGSEVWTRIVIGPSFWMKKTRAAVTQAGLIRANNVVAYITFSEADEGPAIGDLLVKGTIEIDIEGNMSAGDFVKLYPDSFVVKSVDPREFGSSSMRHWEVQGS